MTEPDRAFYRQDLEGSTGIYSSHCRRKTRLLCKCPLLLLKLLPTNLEKPASFFGLSVPDGSCFRSYLGSSGEGYFLAEPSFQNVEEAATRMRLFGATPNFVKSENNVHEVGRGPGGVPAGSALCCQPLPPSRPEFRALQTPPAPVALQTTDRVTHLRPPPPSSARVSPHPDLDPQGLAGERPTAPRHTAASQAVPPLRPRRQSPARASSFPTERNAFPAQSGSKGSSGPYSWKPRGTNGTQAPAGPQPLGLPILDPAL